MRNVAQAIALSSVVAAGIPLALAAKQDLNMNEFQSWVGNHEDTTWSGESELWVDPMGNNVEISDATLSVGAGEIGYTWAYKGAEQSGELRWSDEGLQWQDSWHQPAGVALTMVPGHGSLIAAEYSYSAGAGPDWHWRIKLAERPDGTLVLQMTNIAPWGEEARAVRTVVRRTE